MLIGNLKQGTGENGYEGNYGIKDKGLVVSGKTIDIIQPKDIEPIIKQLENDEKFLENIFKIGTELNYSNFEICKKIHILNELIIRYPNNDILSKFCDEIIRFLQNSKEGLNIFKYLYEKYNNKKLKNKFLKAIIIIIFYNINHIKESLNIRNNQIKNKEDFNKIDNKRLFMNIILELKNLLDNNYKYILENNDFNNEFKNEIQKIFNTIFEICKKIEKKEGEAIRSLIIKEFSYISVIHNIEK